MRQVVLGLAMPEQSLLTIVSLLGKKLGSIRCIASCATFYLLLMAVMKGEDGQWEFSIGLEGDFVLPGTSLAEEIA